MRIGFSLLALALGLLQAGCGNALKEEDIVVKAANDPLHEPRNILKRYAEGQPLGSEVAGFDALVANVRKVDPERAEVLKKGLDEIVKAPASARAAKARALQAKLAPSMK